MSSPSNPPPSAEPHAARGGPGADGEGATGRTLDGAGGRGGGAGAGAGPGSGLGSQPSAWQEIAWIFAVDLRREGRSLAVLGVAVLLAIGVVGACALAGLGHGGASLASAAVWVAVAFVGVHAASGAYAPEQQSGALTALLCGPVRPLSLYLGKSLGILLFTGIGAVTAVVAAALLLHPAVLGAHPGRLLAIVALGAFGFSVVGGLFGPLLGLGGSRDALLALLLLPLGVPLVVTCARATQALLKDPAALDVYRDSVGIAAGLDGLFLAGALWLFEPLVRRNK